MLIWSLIGKLCDRPDGPKGGSSKGGTPAKLTKVELDSVEEVEAFYEADPEFFRIKTTADIPTDLKWEDGSNEKTDRDYCKSNVFL